MFLYIENGLRTPSNVELLPKGTGGPQAISPSLIVHEDESDLTDCFVAIRLARAEPAPSTWRQVRVVIRDQRWFVERMRSWGRIFILLPDKLSPRQGYVIYHAPAVDGPKPVKGL